jgi:hypothetical protein
MAQLYWYCAFCHTGNHPAAVFCGSCGHPRPRLSFLSKITPGLLIAGGLLFAAGMVFAGLLVAVTRAPMSEPRALRATPQSTPLPVASSSPSPASTPTPAAKKKTPTPTPTLEEILTVESEPSLSYTAPRDTKINRSNGYIRGPRGGCYYLNSSGNKTYVDRSLCGTESPSQPLYSAPSETLSGGYIRGPRGACYYINSRGNKTYVDRSLCD